MIRKREMSLGGGGGGGCQKIVKYYLNCPYTVFFSRNSFYRIASWKKIQELNKSITFFPCNCQDTFVVVVVDNFGHKVISHCVEIVRWITYLVANKDNPISLFVHRLDWGKNTDKKQWSIFPHIVKEMS